MRRQQGRSFKLSNVGPSPMLRERLIFTGGVGKGNKGIGDAYASAVSIACSRDGAPGSVLGTIEWGTDGHSNTARFDWLQGTVIHVAGSAFTLTAELIPDKNEEALAPDLTVTAGASIAYYASSRQRPTRTLYAAGPIGGAVDVEIPAFAASLHLSSDVSPLAVAVEFRTDGGLVLSTYLAADFAAGAFVPVPNGATFARFTTVGAQVFAAVFGLSL